MYIIFTFILCTTLTLIGADNSLNSVHPLISQNQGVLSPSDSTTPKLQVLEASWQKEKNNNYLKAMLLLSAEAGAAIYFSKKIKDPANKLMFWVSLGGIAATYFSKMLINIAAHRTAIKVAKKEIIQLLKAKTYAEATAMEASLAKESVYTEIYAAKAEKHKTKADIYRSRMESATSPSFFVRFFSIFQ